VRSIRVPVLTTLTIDWDNACDVTTLIMPVSVKFDLWWRDCEDMVSFGYRRTKWEAEAYS